MLARHRQPINPSRESRGPSAGQRGGSGRVGETAALGLGQDSQRELGQEGRGNKGGREIGEHRMNRVSADHRMAWEIERASPDYS